MYLQEEEVIQAKAKFEVPRVFIWVLTILLTALMVAGCILDSINPIRDKAVEISVIIIVYFVLILVFVFWTFEVEDSEFVVTNKKIYVEIPFWLFGTRKYCFRVDELNNLNSVSIFGMNGMVISFRQGFWKKNIVLKIKFIKNCDDVFQKISIFMMSIKSDKELETDRVNAEVRMAVALEKAEKSIKKTE